MSDAVHAACDNLSYADAGPAVLLIADVANDRLEPAVTAIGGRVIRRIGWEAIADRTICHGTHDFVAIEAAGVPAERLAAMLPRIDAIAGAAGTAVVIAFDTAQIDAVAGSLLGGGATLLCDPQPLECAAALAMAAVASGGPRLHDALREGESARLERLNAEVARIADTLARLTRGDEPRVSPSPLGVADRSLGFGVQPTASDVVRPADVRRIIRTRRLRDAVFGVGLFEDPAWDMLLDLFAAELERAQVSVSSLCIAAAVAPTTALRWIAKLADAGMFVREADPFDRRRAFIALSPKASAAMREYWAAATRAGAALG